MKINSIIIQELEPNEMNVGWLKPSTGELMFPVNGVWVTVNKLVKNEFVDTQNTTQQINNDDDE